ncbi:hypothetical protein [Thermoflavimicrobium dichotomicum]|uniref:Uncharacterized protein n=1 Tax=Thermoflavimicrobium dichotomicum TaxID=46223 RepID=A0A1I3LM02_9BACL|nr:hypothetical protein [Thermoflavimicrobium dichotomicum]SFI85506.1 hypothetical protein SAMN05421852_102238 [Thermoflavimicrobium dichotomicum]
MLKKCAVYLSCLVVFAFGIFTTVSAATSLETSPPIQNTEPVGP